MIIAEDFSTHQQNNQETNVLKIDVLRMFIFDNNVTLKCHR